MKDTVKIFKPFLVSLAILALGYASIANAAPYFRQEGTIVPKDSTENVGTSTNRWDEGWFNNLNATSFTLSSLVSGNLNVNGCGLFGTTSTTTICGDTSNSTFLGTGRVGVGTSTPWGKFSVGASNLSLSTPLFVVASSSNAVATTTHFIVTGTGNVGIGTTGPESTLDVRGNPIFGPVTGAGTISMRDTTGTARVFMDFGGNIRTFGSSAFQTNIVGAIMTINSGTNRSMTFTAGTDVNAGAAVPYPFTATINRTDTAYTAYQFNVTESAAAASGNKLMDVLVGASSKFVITNTGNVGIGTSSPTTLLHVDSAETGTGQPANFGGLIVESSQATPRKGGFFLGGANDWVMGAISNHTLNIARNNDVVMKFDTSDYTYTKSRLMVGSTSVSPTSNLHISGGASLAEIRLQGQNSGTANGDGSMLALSGQSSPNDTNFEIIQNENRDINFYTNYGYGAGDTSPRMTILRGGNVGVGTTTPVANFQVTNSSANSTTSASFGKINQNKGTCITYYSATGTPVYMVFLDGAAAPTYTATKLSGCQD